MGESLLVPAGLSERSTFSWIDAGDLRILLVSGFIHSSSFEPEFYFSYWARQTMR